jgi:general secretion pathway protein J
VTRRRVDPGHGAITRHLSAGGFTLLELVIALAIVGALLVVAFGGLRVAVSAWQRGEQRAEAQQYTRSVTLTLARALSATYPYRAQRVAGEQPLLLFTGSPHRIEFVTQLSPFPVSIPVAFTAVVIELREGTERPGLVVRQRVLPNHDPFEDTPPVIEDEGVKGLTFSYLGDAGWQDEWKQEGTEAGLPRAVRITIDTGTGESSTERPTMTVAIGASRL